ncbi:Sec-independent protein translocase protein TatB [Thiohalophilus sp.]|uniref:Sec-independent protein translocase protein TatB n=1 Tax=Thiohalophilus sp. TaxID=3028392 RepID=UPI002ACE48BC|nr:Sec-independent protein translocase protein TatB [Thiohalophilus sp.]MDZ7661576.1 Sec-independent protein translocase protein TatB [Thiohalophilus sp.]
MFDIGFLELIIITVVALVVVGPERLPAVARNVGKWVGRTRRFVTQVKSDIDREMKQEELRKALEEDAGLDEIKQIMNSDRFTIEEEEKPDYLVKATGDDETEQTSEQSDAEIIDKPHNDKPSSDTAADEQEKPER